MRYNIDNCKVYYECNRELARKYLSSTADFTFSSGTNPHFRYAAIIAQSPIDIIDFYGKKGSLDDLNVRGIGSGIKNTLSNILKNDNKKSA
tara:strand:+ start:231 stop:503 length:273 start_codon:yes stop_codon:yes gene_type:complete